MKTVLFTALVFCSFWAHAQQQQEDARKTNSSRIIWKLFSQYNTDADLDLTKRAQLERQEGLLRAIYVEVRGQGSVDIIVNSQVVGSIVSQADQAKLSGFTLSDKILAQTANVVIRKSSGTESFFVTKVALSLHTPPAPPAQTKKNQNATYLDSRNILSHSDSTHLRDEDDELILASDIFNGSEIELLSCPSKTNRDAKIRVLKNSFYIAGISAPKGLEGYTNPAYIVDQNGNKLCKD